MTDVLKEYFWNIGRFSSFQFSHSVVSDSLRSQDYSMPGLPVHHQLLEFIQTNVHWVSDAIQPSHHLSSLSSPPSIFPSIFANESVLHIRWPEYWSFSFNISPSNEHSGLISFRMDWLDLLAVQGTLKSLLQHHSSKTLISSHNPLLVTPLHSREKKPSSTHQNSNTRLPNQETLTSHW